MVQKVIDTLTFPLRALTLFYEDRCGLSSQSTERYEYASREVDGYCLDVGCGPGNWFIKKWIEHGIGIDVPQSGLHESVKVVADMKRMPFPDRTFDAVTFLAVLNHIPRTDRLWELTEAYRVLKPGGKVVITMGNPLAEILVHMIVKFYDRFIGTSLDIDNIRGMHEEEDLYMTDSEILILMRTAKFINFRKRYFWTQWALNHLWVGYKPTSIAKGIYGNNLDLVERK